MVWFADNSELMGIWGATIPDVLLFGGVCLPREEITRLKDIVASVKSSYSDEINFPIKYNFKDLKKWYQQEGRVDLYQTLLDDSRQWRLSLLEESLQLNYTIIISCINFHSNKADAIKENKDNVARYAFSNALQRVALYAIDTSADECDVYLDWPDKGNHLPFTREYRSAYYSGCCFENPDNTYKSGPLKELGFSESVFFTKMEENSILQFSDIVLGATREFIDFSLGKKEVDCFGVKLMKIILPKFRGHPGRILGRGLCMAPSGGNLRSMLMQGIYDLRYNNI